MRSCLFTLSVAMVLSAYTSELFAALPASDSASDPAYNGGAWNAGSNGGTGWGGGWSFVQNGTGTKGKFVASSANNGDGDGNGNGDINSAGRAWGLFANGTGEIYAVRPFSGALTIGQTFSIDMDNGFIDANGVIGVRLTSSLTTIDNSTREFEFRFVGGQSNYNTISNPNQNSTLGFTDGGLHMDFTLTGPNTFSLSVTRFHDTSGPVVWNTTGNLVTGAPILGVALRNQNAGTGTQRDGFFNNMAITPEPGAICLLGVGLLLVRRRR